MKKTKKPTKRQQPRALTSLQRKKNDKIQLKRKPQSLRDQLKSILPKSLHKHIIKSFDIIGDIAILDIPKELIKYEKKIAQSLLTSQKALKTVCKKTGPRKGFYRRQPLKILAGKRSKETIHKESNTRLKLHVENVYFSPRLSTERMRIANQVKKNENILSLFSGCAPYPCVIAKNAKPKSITAIELNPIAHKYAVINTKLNKVQDIVKPIQGDVRKVLPRIQKKKPKPKWDRIIMSLPFKNQYFFDVVIPAASKGTVIHYYEFAEEKDFKKVEQKVKDACKKEKRKCKIITVKKCGQHAPRTFRVVVDFKLLN